MTTTPLFPSDHPPLGLVEEAMLLDLFVVRQREQRLLELLQQHQGHRIDQAACFLFDALRSSSPIEPGRERQRPLDVVSFECGESFLTILPSQTEQKKKSAPPNLLHRRRFLDGVVIGSDTERAQLLNLCR